MAPSNTCAICPTTTWSPETSVTLGFESTDGPLLARSRGHRRSKRGCDITSTPAAPDNRCWEGNVNDETIRSRSEFNESVSRSDPDHTVVGPKKYKLIIPAPFFKYDTEVKILPGSTKFQPSHLAEQKSISNSTKSTSHSTTREIVNWDGSKTIHTETITTVDSHKDTALEKQYSDPDEPLSRHAWGIARYLPGDKVLYHDRQHIIDKVIVTRRNSGAVPVSPSTGEREAPMAVSGRSWGYEVLYNILGDDHYVDNVYPELLECAYGEG